MPSGRTGQKGISQGSLSTILAGNPTVGTLAEVANILGMSVSQLIAESQEAQKEFVALTYCDGTPRYFSSVRELRDWCNNLLRE